jgi:hypothetical protein
MVKSSPFFIAVDAYLARSGFWEVLYEADQLRSGKRRNDLADLVCELFDQHIALRWVECKFTVIMKFCQRKGERNVRATERVFREILTA